MIRIRCDKIPGKPSLKSLLRERAVGGLMLASAAIGLAACNSGSLTEGLSPAGQTLRGAPQPLGNVEGSQSNAGGQQQQASLAGEIEPVAFLPVTGAPQSAVANLAGAMRSAARVNSVPVVTSVERGARFQVKGYFSALNDGSGTLLVYVWDILDAGGQRLHRISGQERGSHSQGDPWTGIDQDVLLRVANLTMRDLREWMAARGAG